MLSEWQCHRCGRDNDKGEQCACGCADTSRWSLDEWAEEAREMAEFGRQADVELTNSIRLRGAVAAVLGQCEPSPSISRRYSMAKGHVDGLKEARAIIRSRAQEQAAEPRQEDEGEGT
jgi:hypothetical protein